MGIFNIKVRVRVDNRLKVGDCIALIPLHLQNMFGRSMMLPPQTKMVLPKKYMAQKRTTTRSQVCLEKGKPNIVHIFITTELNILT